jgi:hypothetical protein
MVTVRQVIDAHPNPIRRNDLEVRRRRLGLSRVALGRILDVDPATVFRRERGPLFALWDHALRGIEAEAADKSSKRVVRDFKSGLDLQTFIPDQLDARGHSYTAAKMRDARRQHALGKSRPAQPLLSDKPRTQKAASRTASADGRRGQLSKTKIKQIADRAEGLKD